MMKLLQTIKDLFARFFKNNPHTTHPISVVSQVSLSVPDEGLKMGNAFSLSWETHPTFGRGDRASWTSCIFFLVSEPKTWSLLSKAKDLEDIYPGISSLPAREQQAIVCEFFCWLSYFETVPKWNEKSVGAGVKSQKPNDQALGLYQMSVNDQSGWQTGTTYTRDELLQAIPNIIMMLKIMTKLVERNGVLIPTKGKHKWFFWAPILNNGKYDADHEIIKEVRKFKI